MKERKKERKKDFKLKETKQKRVSKYFIDTETF